jgi:hypothetical protein
MVENNLLSQLIVEDGKNAKKYYVGKNMSCSFFSKFIKKKLFPNK